MCSLLQLHLVEYYMLHSYYSTLHIIKSNFLILEMLNIVFDNDCWASMCPITGMRCMIYVVAINSAIIFTSKMCFWNQCDINTLVFQKKFEFVTMSFMIRNAELVILISQTFVDQFWLFSSREILELFWEMLFLSSAKRLHTSQSVGIFSWAAGFWAPALKVFCIFFLTTVAYPYGLFIDADSVVLPTSYWILCDAVIFVFFSANTLIL